MRIGQQELRACDGRRVQGRVVGNEAGEGIRHRLGEEAWVGLRLLQLRRGEHVQITGAAGLIVSGVDIVGTAAHIGGVHCDAAGQLVLNAGGVLQDVRDLAVGIGEDHIAAERGVQAERRSGGPHDAVRERVAEGGGRNEGVRAAAHGGREVGVRCVAE